MQIAILAVGSRGDVEPMLALALGLRDRGHGVRLGALEPFRAMVEGFGLEFTSLGSLPTRFTRKTGRRRVPTFNGLTGRALFWAGYTSVLADRLEGFVQACVGADAIVFGGLAFPVCHLAEALGVPCLWASPAPHVATRAFADPFFAGSWYATAATWRASYAVEEQLRLQTSAHLVDRWRRDVLGLPRVGRRALGRHVRGLVRGVLCNSSAVLVPRPADWPGTAHVTGHWRLPTTSWTPSPALRDFLDAGEPPIHIGFGSMADRDPEGFARLATEAVRRAGVRAVISGLPVEPSDDVFVLDGAPHDALLPRIAAAVHHGGAGTTAATLEAGVPSVVVPSAYDQFFWAARLQRLGVAGRPLVARGLRAVVLAAAIREVGGVGVRRRAKGLQRAVQGEDGVRTAVGIIEAA